MAPQPTRPVMTFAQLCVVAREQYAADPLLTDMEWRRLIQNRVLALHFRMPATKQVYQAISAVEHAEAKAGRARPVHQRQATTSLAGEAPLPPATPLPTTVGPTHATFTPVGAMVPSTPWNTCGASKNAWGARPLVCNLDAGHAGRHGIRSNPGLPPFVHWSDE